MLWKIEYIFLSSTSFYDACNQISPIQAGGRRNHLCPISALDMGAYNAKNGPKNGLVIQVE